MCLKISSKNGHQYRSYARNDRAVIKNTSEHRKLAGKMVKILGVVGGMVAVCPMTIDGGLQKALVSPDDFNRILMM